jgi:hypothetical protein
VVAVVEAVMSEWKDYEFSSECHLGELQLFADFDDDNEQWCAIALAGVIAHFPTREAAKSAAEAEARRVLLDALRGLGWPDEAAVERLWCQVAADILRDLTGRRGIRQAFDEIDEEVQFEICETISRIVRAALTAAMEPRDV